MHVMWTGFGSNLTADIILSNMVPHSTAHFLSSPFCGLLLFFPFPAFFSLSSTSCSCALFLLQSHYLSFLSLSGFDHPCERSFLWARCERISHVRLWSNSTVASSLQPQHHFGVPVVGLPYGVDAKERVSLQRTFSRYLLFFFSSLYFYFIFYSRRYLFCFPGEVLPNPLSSRGWRVPVCSDFFHRLYVYPMITLPPGYIGTGIQQLLKSELLQEQLIDRAVRLAVTKNFVGYNIDWESNPGFTTNQLGEFLLKFKNRLNEKGKILSFDGFGAPWDVVDISKGYISSTTPLPHLTHFTSIVVDVEMDMSTYGMSGPDLIPTILQNSDMVGGLDHYGLGLLPQMMGPDDVAWAFEVAQNLSVPAIYTWPNERYYQLPNYWWYTAALWLSI